MKNIFFLMSVLFVTGCASNHSPDVYSKEEASRLNNITPAVVLNVRMVTLKGDKEVGAVTGAALGGIGGYMAGGNDELRAAGAVVGALAGGVAGAFVQETAETEKAYEYILEKESGKVQTIVQAGEMPYAVGQKVYIVYTGEKVKVIPAGGQ